MDQVEREMMGRVFRMAAFCIPLVVLVGYCASAFLGFVAS